MNNISYRHPMMLFFHGSNASTRRKDYFVWLRALNESTLGSFKRRREPWTSRLWNFTVQQTASFLAAVLTHPLVQNAASQIVVKGMNAALTQPDFPERLATISREMDYKDTAREIGHQLPSMALSFVGGAVSSITGQKRKDQLSTTSSGSQESNTGANDETIASLDRLELLPTESGANDAT